MFELMFHDDEQVDLKRYIRAFVSLVFLIDYISRFYQTALEELFDAGIVIWKKSRSGEFRDLSIDSILNMTRRVLVLNNQEGTYTQINWWQPLWMSGDVIWQVPFTNLGATGPCG